MEPLLKKPRTRVLGDKLSLNGLTSSSEIMYEGVHHAKDTVTKYRQYMSLTFLWADLKADLHGTIFAYDCRMRFL